jgi:hypothetical protein
MAFLRAATIVAVMLFASQPAHAIEWYVILDQACSRAILTPDQFEEGSHSFEFKRTDVPSGDMVVFTKKTTDAAGLAFFNGKFMCEWMLERSK